MWAKLAQVILRNRLAILLVVGLLTALMAWQATSVTLYYGLPKMLPEDDSTLVAYANFQDRFYENSAIMIVGMEKDPLQDKALFNAWQKLGNDLMAIDGVDTILSITHLVEVKRNKKEKRFTLETVSPQSLQNDQQLDTVRNKIHDLKIYEGLVFNPENGSHLMAVSLNREIFDSKDRSGLFDTALETLSEFETTQNVQLHYSGMPYIRTTITELVKTELRLFIMLSLLVTIIILFLFFKSIRPVLVSVLVVGLGVVFTVGIMGLLGYKISILTSVIPPLLIVIGIPNCIFLINKYHSEYKRHQNQAMALTRVVTRIGKATFMTNATTAVGFLTFIFTDSSVLIEFGIVASLGILTLFIMALLMIVIIFSYLSPPSEKLTGHLEQNWVYRFVVSLTEYVQNKRPIIYGVTVVLVLAAFFGISKITTTGNMVDDLPAEHQIVKDLHFIETNFAGVMPFDVSIDAKKLGRASNRVAWKKIDQVQGIFSEYDEFSNPISIVQGIKWMRQGFYNGNPEKFDLVKNQERAFFKKYIDNSTQTDRVLSDYLDSTRQYTRIGYRMADVGTTQMDSLFNELQPRVDSILDPEKYDVSFTGSTVVFLAGTKYLVKNLFISLGLAILIVAGIMALFFSSFRMILISVSVNLLPLIITAGIMGFAGISIKPSTILVFSIAFGISVDDTIHFLAKYRQELKAANQNIGQAVIYTLKDTGLSMTYTSIILFFGFSVFDISEFGGTQALGVLVSLTLFVAMLANLVLLPSLLLSLEKAILTKSFKEPLMEMFDEEEDIELEELKIENNEKTD